MVSEAEKYKAEDEAAASRISARNGFESYVYNIRNSVNEEQFASKLSDEDKETLKKVTSEAIEWLDASAEASEEEYKSRQSEVEAAVSPIMQRAYGAGGGGMPGGAPGAAPGAAAPGGDEPSVEEVD